MLNDNELKKLLLVDDDDATRILVYEILGSENLNIIEAVTGQEGFYLFQKHSKGLVLVLLDIKLPDCSGWDLIKQLRNENSQIPIIALSATNPLELKENYKKTGFNSYLSKPFDIVELERIVECYLKHETKSV